MTKPAKDLEPIELVDAMKADDLRARVWGVFTKNAALLAQANAQDKAPAFYELLRMEMQAAEEIIQAVQQFIREVEI